MARPVTLTVEVLAVDTGLWCRDCALPSGVRVHLVLGKSRMGTLVRCRDCGGDEVD